MKFIEEQIDKSTSLLTRINWSCIAGMILFLLSTSLIQKNFGKIPEIGFAAKLYFMAITIGVAAIPLSSWYFSKKIKKIVSSNSLEVNLRVYRVAFIYKLSIVLIAFILNLVLLYFSGNPHLLIIGAIYIVFQMVAIQSRENMINLLGIAIPEKNQDASKDA